MFGRLLWHDALLVSDRTILFEKNVRIGRSSTKQIILKYEWKCITFVAVYYRWGSNCDVTVVFVTSSYYVLFCQCSSLQTNIYIIFIPFSSLIVYILFENVQASRLLWSCRKSDIFTCIVTRTINPKVWELYLYAGGKRLSMTIYNVPSSEIRWKLEQEVECKSDWQVQGIPQSKWPSSSANLFIVSYVVP